MGLYNRSDVQPCKVTIRVARAVASHDSGVSSNPCPLNHATDVAPIRVQEKRTDI